ncbi:alkaline phosphatase D family protein [Isoalcanivorax beigongshangi]|uniref:Alkaline phosphatase n=1 Tax=Isoalcanivorax beigongshangi TaxID=3238810 RepID=A0ABV4AEW9_9GAMM
MKRRDFIKGSAMAGLSLGLLSACGGESSSGNNLTQPSLPNMPAYDGPNPFQHGVASGDPWPRQVILWTRLTAPGLDEVPVIVEVATDPLMVNVIYQGFDYARSDSDFTIKMDPLLPEPDTTYYYRFNSLGFYSPLGRTRTSPESDAVVDRARFALVSCSNYPYGYFNAYRKVAQRADLSAVIHLGDYIYEYGPGEYEDAKLKSQRPLDPPHPIVTLEDYRRRYALYRGDMDLQECHRQHPFICVWDDHEVADNSWREGAANHNNGQGDYADRKRAAVRAYHEWMPIRAVLPDDLVRIYRTFDYGQLLSLIMLDTRLIGRDRQATLPHETRDPNRTLLGLEQERWLFDEMERSQSRGAHWHILGQQVMMAHLTLGAVIDNPNWDVGGGIKINYDQWDGYYHSRKAVLDRIDALALDNTVVLTGDIHSSWAFDLSPDPGNLFAYNPFNGDGSKAVEFVVPAVSSPAAPTKGLSDLAFAFLYSANPHLKWVDLFHRGYVVLDITPEHCQADWFHLKTVQERSNEETFARSYQTATGRNRVSRVKQPSAPLPNPAPLAPRLLDQEVVA